MNAPPAASRRWTEVVIVLLIVGAGFALRIAKLDQVAAGDELQIFPDDPPYHLRRAIMTLADWPRVPTSDPMLNFPEGAKITWPPGMAWLLAGSGRLLGARGPGDLAKLERVAIWIPPILGALTVFAVYLGTRRLLRSTSAAAIAAIALAILPAHAEYTVIGRYDHHIFEPLLSWLFLLGIAFASGSSTRRGLWAMTALGAGSAGLALLFWPGALLHLALFFVALLAATLGLNRADPDASRRLARAAALCFALSTVTSLPAVFLSPWATRPVFFAASPLQSASLAAAAVVFLAIGWGRVLTPLARGVVALGAVAIPFLVVPALRLAILDGVRYTLRSPFAPLASESAGFLADPQDFVALTGWPALLATTAATLVLLRIRSTRKADLAPLTMILAATLAAFMVGLVSVRWLVAWAPFGAFAVAAAWTLVIRPLGERWSPARPRRWAILWGTGAAALVVPALLHVLSLDLAPAAQQRALRFFRELRQLTPPATANEHAVDARPSYGILTLWSSGHWITYLSGRPTLANNFFGAPSQDRANALAFRLLLTPDCDGVAEEMRRLRLRYVVIAPPEPRRLPLMARIAGLDPSRYLGPSGELLEAARRSLLGRLGPADGESIVVETPTGLQGLPGCGRFRLLAELPGEIKVYERVEGATVELAGAPGAPAGLSLALRTREGRAFTWCSRALLDGRGRARFRVPYPTDGSCWSRVRPCAVSTAAAYRAVVGHGTAAEIRVSERAIQTGEGR